MKKYILLLLFPVFVYCQNKSYSFNFNNETLPEVFFKINSKTNYRFFFNLKWFEKSEVRITDNFENKEVEFILSAVLNKTKFNFYVDKTNIIISENVIIYDYFLDDYFEKNENINNINKINIGSKEDIIYIGKQTKNVALKKVILSGNVKNIETQLAVKNYTISCGDLKTTTNENGDYSFEIPTGFNKIIVNSFQSRNNKKNIFISENGTLNFEINEKTIGIKEVVIKTAIQAKIKTATVGATSIDLENMKNVPILLGEQDVFKVLTILPGVKTAGEGSTGLNVRGGNADQNLILVDNISLYNPFHFLGFFSSINPYSLKAATIYKGSIPIEYGGRLSSVIELKTKEPNLEKFSGEGGVGPVTTNLYLTTPIIKGKSGISTGIRATYSDWILKNLDNKQLKNSNASFYDFSAKYTHNFNKKNTVNGYFYYSNDKYKITSDSTFQYNNRLVGINWEHKFLKKSNFQIGLNNTNYKFGIDYDNQYDVAKSFNSGYNINETNANLKIENKISDFINPEYGITSKLYEINPGFLNPKDKNSLIIPIEIKNEKALEWSFFFKNESKITSKLLLNFGIRYTNYFYLGANKQNIYTEGLPKSEATLIEIKDFKNNETIKQYDAFEPRFSLRFLLTNTVSLKASYDKTNQFIHLLTTNTTQAPTDIWKLSDINIKPQSGEQFSLGVFKNLNEIYEISLEGYYKNSKNLLDYKTGANIVLSEKIETELLQGIGKSYGIEFLIKKNIGKFNGWLAYTYSRSFIQLNSIYKDQTINNGQFFATNFDKPHDFNAVMNFKLTKRYSFSLNMIYQTGRPITYPVGKYTFGNAEYTLYSDRNQFRIPDYYRVDFSFNMEGNHKIKKLAHSFWNISIYNLLGRNNPYAIYFVTEKGEVKGYQTSIFSIPIPTITYNFKF